MIIIKHGNNPEPKRWKFKCCCGCEWIADETDVVRFCNRSDVRQPRGIMSYHAICYCPDCERLVEDERRAEPDEYESILMQTDPSALVRYVNLGDGITTQTKEESCFESTSKTNNERTVFPKGPRYKRNKASDQPRRLQKDEKGE